MILKNDCYILLADLEKKGINTKEPIMELVNAQNNIPLSVIKFINDNRQLDLTCFFERIRKNYNQKKSQLYKNIVSEITNPNEVIVTLSALLTQILLYANKLENKQMFLRHARCNEITIVLNNYFKTYDITNCIKLLQLIKADIKCLESLKNV